MSTPTGRHRAPEHHSSTAALSSALSRSAQPAAKASAVVAVSAGLVAAFSLPASAGPQQAPAHAAAGVSGVAASLPDITDVSAASGGVGSAATVALTAAAPVRSGLMSPTFGDIGFTGIVKPKLKPQLKPKPQTKPRPTPVVKVVRVVHAVAPRPAPVHHVAPRPAQHSSRSTVRRVIHRVVHHTVHRAPAHHSTPSAGSAHSGILAIAARYAGVRYVYGGSSPSGFDCSGFTSYVFRQAGISLPRTAHAQQGAVHHVSSPQPGDLVFFGSPAYHVGIYAGGGKMWDAPHTGSTVGLHTIYGGVSGYGRP